LESTRELERQEAAEIERLIREDQQAQNNKQLMKEKREAAARRRLFCDVKAVQQLQREEKGNSYIAICISDLYLCCLYPVFTQCACVHFLSAICDHRQELLDTVAKHRFVQKISVLSE